MVGDRTHGLASLALFGIAVIVALSALRIFGLPPGASASPTAAGSEPPRASTRQAPLAGSPASATAASAASTRASTRGPLAGDLPAPVTLSGSSAWFVQEGGVSLSNDGGRTWAIVALPSDVASSQVAAVATAPGRPMWLAVGSGDGYVVYRKPASAAPWSSVLLTPSWASLPSPGGQADMVKIILGPGSLVTVAETMSGGSTAAVTSLFVSNDDGNSFEQHPPQSGSAANMYWPSVTLTTPQSGLVIAGPHTYPHVFLHTSNGGRTWSESRVSGLPSAPDYTPDTPLVVGEDILVPVTVCGTDCGRTTFLMLISHDGGATLDPMGVPISSAGNGYPAAAALGSVVWVATRDAIEETTDSGKAWTAVPATGLPINVTSIALTGPTSATAVVADSGCAGFKTDCWYRNYLVATTDGGRTWSRV